MAHVPGRVKCSRRATVAGREREREAGPLREPFPLSRNFLAASARPHQGGPAPDWLDPELRRIDSAGRSAWPSLSLDAETFAAHLARVTDAQGDVREALSTVRADDLF